MSVRSHERWRDVEGATWLEAVDDAGIAIPGPRAAVVGLTHGNEIVGDAVLTRLLGDAERQLVRGSLLLLRHNLVGFAANRRNSEGGTDLNRLWDRDRLASIAAKPSAARCWEESRALEVAPLLLAQDAVLDLHSTSRPSPPFLVFRDDQAHGALARRLGVPRLVTGLHEQAILDGGMVPDAGLAPGEHGSRIGLLFESGQHLDPVNRERAGDVCARFLHAVGVWRDAPPLPDAAPSRVYEVTDRVKQVTAERMGEPWRFVGFEGGEPGAGRVGPPRALASFDEIEAGEMVLRKGRDVVVRAQAPFTMLLPTPSADPDTDLYYVTRERPAPRTGGRTHEQAKIEAAGIERMLDLLDEDEFSRGATRVSFETRHLLDTCADLVGRTIRLPVDHPHRRLLIIGRGDWGGDEIERRAGMRYRKAVRKALAEGVALDRIQLLRGAPLGWIRQLTRPHLADRFARRAAGGREEPLRLWLSVRQPHTVSLLVAGDIDRALYEGDFQHVCVAVLVEAASVEPEGSDARVRIGRMGLFSARPEILRTARRLIDGLTEEHRYLVRRAPLADHPDVAALLDDDFAIRPTADPSRLDGLWRALYDLQTRQWREALRHEAPAHLASDDAVGQWLAHTMSTTGVLDSVALKSLVVRADPAGGYRTDPGALDERRPDAATVEPLLVPPPVRAIPDQELCADEVDADRIERWIGWKRFVRGVQSVPDTRGRDLELTFDEARIGGHARDTLAWAHEEAARRPGRVLVIIAGDGQRADRERKSPAGIVDAHSRVVMDPNLRYLRIQHAQGTFLSWWKDVGAVLQRRPLGAAPLGVQWEGAHGSSLNVLIVATCDHDILDDPYRLEGWTIQRCSVLLSELRATGSRDYRIGLYTQADGDRPPNPELVQFGRAHCQALLAQGGPRLTGLDGPPDQAAFADIVRAQIAGWLTRARSWTAQTNGAPLPKDPAWRVRWVSGQLGLGDAWLASRIAGEIDGTDPVEDVAHRIWEEVPAW